MEQKTYPAKKKEIHTPVQATKKLRPLPPKPKVVKKLLEKSVRQYLTKLPLAKGQKIIPAGTLTGLEWLGKPGVEKLIKMGAVRSVLSPPLAELAGWETRAKRLEPVGVKTMADFLAVDAVDLAKVLRAKEETILGWQAQIKAWSETKQPPRR